MMQHHAERPLSALCMSAAKHLTLEMENVLDALHGIAKHLTHEIEDVLWSNG